MQMQMHNKTEEPSLETLTVGEVRANEVRANEVRANEVRANEFRANNDDLDQADGQAVTPQAVPANYRYGLFTPTIHLALSNANTFAIGAAIRHHPVHKGAITALMGGTLTGIMLTVVGRTLRIKQQGNSLRLAVCNELLIWAATLGCMPVGTLVMPFRQNLPISVLIEDQLVGIAVFIFGPPLTGILLCLCCALTLYTQFDPLRRAALREGVMSGLRANIGVVDIAMTIAELPTSETASEVTADPAPLTTSEENNLPTAFALQV